MYRVLEYTIFFIVALLLQIFLFSRIGISVYLHPLAYIAFIILLPMGIAPTWLLLLALIQGVTMDFFMATAGLNTIATLFVAFCRPTLLSLLVGPDPMYNNEIPNVKALGKTCFLKYAACMVVLHSLVFFFFEVLSVQMIYRTLIRVIFSSGVTLAVVYFYQKVFFSNSPKT